MGVLHAVTVLKLKMQLDRDDTHRGELQAVGGDCPQAAVIKKRSVNPKAAWREALGLRPPCAAG